MGNSTNFVNIPITFEGIQNGTLEIKDIRFDYAGGNDTINVTIHSVDYSYVNQTNIIVWYSDYFRRLPYTWVDVIFFLPSTNNSKNISAYGQTLVKPIYNITTTNYGGKDMNMSIRLNESISCLNVTYGYNGTKPLENVLNTSWQQIFSGMPYKNNSRIWLWADLNQCNPSDARILRPEVQLESYCVDCTWDN